jgi:hypothetical protein
MKQMTIQEDCPVHVEEITKDQTSLKSVDEIIAYIKEKIDNDPTIAYIGEFDHYAHTTSLPKGKVHPSVKAAKNILFCFGPMIPSAYMMALKPRSIGVSETEDGFVIAFAEAALPMANKVMTEWAESVKTV